MHDLIGFGVIVIGLLAGIWLNNRSVVALETRMDKRFELVDKRFDRLEDKMDKRFDAIQANFNEFYRTIGQHDNRLDNLEKK